MTKEQKQLLLKDLCGRLPYKPFVNCVDSDTKYKCVLTTAILDEMRLETEYYEYKPYLRPMSSMTEDEKHILENLSNCYIQTKVLERDRKGKIKKEISYLDNEIEEMDLFGDNDSQYRHVNQKNFVDTSDFFNSRYLDWRGLIPMGLALEAPKDMYKEE